MTVAKERQSFQFNRVNTTLIGEGRTVQDTKDFKITLLHGNISLTTINFKYGLIK